MIFLIYIMYSKIHCNQIISFYDVISKIGYQPSTGVLFSVNINGDDQQ